MKYRRIIFAIAAVFLLALSGFQTVVAQQQGGSGLQLSPTRTELSVQPGESKEFSLVVKNVTQGDVTVKTFLNDFEADNNTGDPKLIVDDSPSSSTSLKSYLKNLEDFDLKGGDSKEVKLSVDFPADAGAGGYFGAVRFVAVPKGQQATADRQVALNASVASLVLVQVEGNIIEQVAVNKVEVRRDNKPSTFFTSKPNKLAVDIENKGNSFSKPFGRVQIMGMFNREAFSYEINNKDPRGNVLPRTSRVFVDDIQGISMPGRYTAIVNVSYGSGGEIITQKVSFWYIPFWIIGIIIGVILLIAGGGYVLYRRRGSRGKRR